MTIKLSIGQYFLSKEWFRGFFKKSFFYKINGLWYKYSAKDIPLKFKEEEKILDAEGPGITCWIYCQNVECESIINTGSFTGERETKNELIWDFTCTCCKKEQHFIADIVMIPCDKYGNPL